MSRPDSYAEYFSLATANRKRCLQDFGETLDANGWSVEGWFMAITGELGEAANKAKKIARGRGPGAKPGDRAVTPRDVADELADVVIYVDLLTQRLGFDLGDVVRDKFNAKSEQYQSRCYLHDDGTPLQF